MTREECKDILVSKINVLGSVRADEFVAWTPLYIIDGFSQAFHPDMLKQLVMENKIATIEFTLPGKDKPLTYLFPNGTKFKVTNGKLE